MSTKKPNDRDESDEPNESTQLQLDELSDLSTQSSSDDATEEERESSEVVASDFDVPFKPAREYLASSVRDNQFNEDTAHKYATYIRRFVHFLEKHQVKVLNASPQHIDRFLGQWVTTRRQTTIDEMLSGIRGFYRYLIGFRNDLECSMNYLALEQLDAPNSDLEPIRRESLSKTELKALLEALDRPRNRLMVLLGALRGPRSGAIRSVKLQDIDWDKKIIKLLDEKDNETYELPLGEKLLNYFDHYINNIRSTHPHADSTDYVFPSDLGGKLENSSSLNSVITKAAEEAGIQETIGKVELTESVKEVLGTDKEYAEYSKVTTHTLRHTFNELLKDRGVSLTVRSKLLNHDNPEVTKTYYDDEIKDLDGFLDDIADFL